MKHVLPLLVVSFMLSFQLFAHTSADTINRLDRFNKRVGYWVLNGDNEPVALNSKQKSKEGTYLNGRKEGVWILYFEDGVSPRLIGEYSDNRPSGAYFRFAANGNLQQASSVPRKLKNRSAIARKNKVFSCEMRFHDKEIVAGQVFFDQKVIKQNAVNFWVERSLEAISSQSKVINFTWLNTNYDAIYSRFLEVRSPKMELTSEDPEIKQTISAIKKDEVRSEPKNLKNAAPMVRNPKVAKGLVFQPNGFNKLFTNSGEIWMDGYFKEGQLRDGKVFTYDRDGVLLKVRVYKDGVYVSDGIL